VLCTYTINFTDIKHSWTLSPIWVVTAWQNVDEKSQVGQPFLCSMQARQRFFILWYPKIILTPSFYQKYVHKLCNFLLCCTSKHFYYRMATHSQTLLLLSQKSSCNGMAAINMVYPREATSLYAMLRCTNFKAGEKNDRLLRDMLLCWWRRK